MKITNTPDRWVILKLRDNDYRVFGVWFGGYLDGDMWRLNSGIVKVEQDEDYYYFTGASGSCYKCNKKSYGITTRYGLSILNEILEKSKGEIKLLYRIEDYQI